MFLIDYVTIKLRIKSNSNDTCSGRQIQWTTNVFINSITWV